MREARNASTMSKDPSSKVGAVLVKDRRIVGTGFNGFPRGLSDDCRLDDREQKLPRVVHAEMNAILNAGREAEGSTLFMYGFSGAPCANCTKHLLQAGIVQVYVCGPELPERWRKDVDISLDMMREADIPVLEVAQEALECYNDDLCT